MKVFLDCEFYEFQPTETDFDEGHRRLGLLPEFHPLPGANAVQLISIGAVREDGAEFYAENAGFDWSNVPDDHWLQENVRPHLWTTRPPGGQWENVPKGLVGGRWTPERIAQEFYEFALVTPPPSDDDGSVVIATASEGVLTPTYDPPEFWGYYCDYDWVVLCGLFGRMVDLPPEFPKYCLDLKQEMRAKERSSGVEVELPPGPSNEHHALADARWNRELYERIFW
jgi:hypothetical protein